jgi:hypothetical protein
MTFVPYVRGFRLVPRSLGTVCSCSVLIFRPTAAHIEAKVSSSMATCETTPH